MSSIARRYTVIFPFSDDGKQILLGLKKRGMGVGLWNGFGVFVYIARDIFGDVIESDEMMPKWFNVAELTYQDTYKEALVWWPTMLAGHTFVAQFEFVDGVITSQKIDHVDIERLSLLRSSTNESHN
ncbi:hypothetical protein GGF42_003205 [Coemansia sp. RSA 2424]|nr:hypothetical protein GGF42_003205 [Coemansia sp. RSA 2424]